MLAIPVRKCQKQRSWWMVSCVIVFCTHGGNKEARGPWSLKKVKALHKYSILAVENHLNLAM